MQKYGVVVDGDLIIEVDQSHEGSKPIRYAEIPEFDQMTQYVIQDEVLETDDEIFATVAVKDLEYSEEYFNEENESE